ncbi:MAG: exosortase/archaeosortase family protein [Myxococcota bacterium]|nr:exosortase/archaeosortase family protein [Myxococcota bacterium]
MTQPELPLETPIRPRAPGPSWMLISGLVVIAAGIALASPILHYMVLHWLSSDGDYTHGLMIIPLALYFAFERRDRLRQVPIETSWWGLVPLTLGSIALAIGRLGVELTSMRSGVILTGIGLVLLLFGRQVFRVLAFPLLFLFLMVPLPQSLVNTIAFPLQLLAAQMAVSALHLLGIPALLEGNIIHLAHSELFVAQACSGLRSLMALITLGVVFAYFLERGIVRRAIIIASTIPIAILVNALRVALTAILAHHYGSTVATGAIHDYQGLIMFGFAFLLLLAETNLLKALPWWREAPGSGGPTP